MFYRLFFLFLFASSVFATSNEFLSLNQKSQLLCFGRWQDSKNFKAQGPTNFWLNQTILSGYAAPLYDSYKGLYRTQCIPASYFHKHFYVNYAKTMRFAYNLNMDAANDLKLNWQDAKSNANYKVENRVFGWWLAPGWSVLDANLYPYNISPSSVLDCYVGSLVLLTETTDHFVYRPAVDAVNTMAFKAILAPVLKSSLNTVASVFILPFQTSSTNSSSVVLQTSQEIKAEKKVKSIITRKDAEVLASFGKTLELITRNFEKRLDANHDIYLKKVDNIVEKHTIKSDEIDANEKALIKSLAALPENRENLDVLIDKGFDLNKINKSLKKFYVQLQEQELENDQFFKLSEKYPDTLAARQKRYHQFNRGFLAYPPTDFAVDKNNYPTNQSGYFLSFKQKAQLLATGRITQDEIYNITYLPGYLDPAYSQFYSFEKLFMRSYDLINYKSYLDICNNTIATTTNGYLGSFYRVLSRSIANVCGCDTVDESSYASKLFKATFGIPIGLVGSTTVAANSLTWNTFTFAFNLTDDLSINALFDCTVEPAIAYSWQSIMAPSMALFGQKPALQRCDNSWVKITNPNEINTKQKAKAPVFKKDLAELVSWYNITCKNIAVFDEERRTVDTEYYDLRKQNLTSYKANKDKIIEEEKSFFMTVKFDQKTNADLSYLKTKYFNREKTKLAIDRWPDCLNPNKEFILYDVASDLLDNLSDMESYINTKQLFDDQIKNERSLYLLLQFPPMSFTNDTYLYNKN